MSKNDSLTVSNLDYFEDEILRTELFTAAEEPHHQYPVDGEDDFIEENPIGKLSKFFEKAMYNEILNKLTNAGMPHDHAMILLDEYTFEVEGRIARLFL